MDTFLKNKFERLQKFTTTLAIRVKDGIPSMQAALDGTLKLPPNFSSGESHALLDLGRIEETLQEINAATREIRKTLDTRHKAKKTRRTS